MGLLASWGGYLCLEGRERWVCTSGVKKNLELVTFKVGVHRKCFNFIMEVGGLGLFLFVLLIIRRSGVRHAFKVLI